VGASAGLPTLAPVFAHLGHWYVSLPVFGAPVLAIAAAVKMSELRARRRARDGDPSSLRVVAVEGGDGTTLKVNGALDYPTLLTIESEIDAAVRRSPHVLLDLSDVKSVEVDLAWSVMEILNAVTGAEIALRLGPAPELQPLRNVCILEDLEVVDDERHVTR
jgi:hypothetical protein